MIKEKIELLCEKPTNRELKLVLISSLVLLVISAPTVIYLLGLSGFTGELEKTQLGFDAEYIRNCFESMTEQGFSFFILGNLADYLFMISYGGMLYSGALLVTRKMENRVIQKIGTTVSLLGILAASCDGLENIFLLSMTLNPTGFPAWLAFPHSLFANIKFKLMYLTAGWIILSSLYLVTNRVLKSSQTISKNMLLRRGEELPLPRH